MRVRLVGLGNPMLSDDGIGVHIVRALAGDPRCAGADVVETSVGGLRLLDLVSGCDCVVLVDAIQTEHGQPGEIYRLRAADLPDTLHSGSSHDLSLAGALWLGRSLHMQVPPDAAIHIVAVEAADVQTFAEACTSPVSAAIPQAIEAVVETLTLLEDLRRQSCPGEDHRSLK